MADAEVIRMVKIKTGTVKRLHKDLNLYKKEFEDQQKKVDRMKEEGCDEHDIKQQEAEADSEQGEEVESAKKVAADAELVFEE
eukprot:jgi/Pico_ML_1/52493/g3191.t1